MRSLALRSYRWRSFLIAWRSQPLVRVDFKDERPPEQCTAREPDAIRDFLFRFVAEEANSKNRLGVHRVELFYPASILADGTVLIDTPGVGSTHTHNTDSALQIIPECDAVLFVVSADPPITEVELDYLGRLLSKTSRIFFILNKADYLAPEEKVLPSSLRKSCANRDWTRTAPVFSVSARNALTAITSDSRPFLRGDRRRSVGDLVLHQSEHSGAAVQSLGPMLNLRLAQPDLLVDITSIPEMAERGAANATWPKSKQGSPLAASQPMAIMFSIGARSSPEIASQRGR
jgi:hypothetical protein